MVDKETNHQTKVHFKMYKDGKQWVTRGLALFAVSLMVGGPVANTLTNVKNNVAFAQTTDSSSSDSVALTNTNNVVSANQKLNADYDAWQKQEVELQKDATFNQFMFMDDVVRNAVLDGHNAAGRGDYDGVVSADAQLLHYVSIVQEALRLLKSVDPATKGYNDLFEDLHLANQHDPKAVEAHVIALGGVVNDLTNANDFDDTKAPDMAGDKAPAQSKDLTDLENRIQSYYQNHGIFGIPAAVIKDVYNEIVAEETTPSKSADADEVKVLQDLFTKMKQADLAYVDSTVHAVVAQAVDANNQAAHDGVPASVKSADFKAINDAATKLLAVWIPLKMMHLMLITITSIFKLTTCNNKWMISKRRLMITRLIKLTKLPKKLWMLKMTPHELVFILLMLMTCSTRAWLKQESHPQLMFAIRLRN